MTGGRSAGRARALCDAWNERHPIGTVCDATDGGRVDRLATVGPARVFCGHTAVVDLVGRPCFPLERVKAAPADAQPDAIKNAAIKPKKNASASPAGDARPPAAKRPAVALVVLDGARAVYLAPLSGGVWGAPRCRPAPDESPEEVAASIAFSLGAELDSLGDAIAFDAVACVGFYRATLARPPAADQATAHTAAEVDTLAQSGRLHPADVAIWPRVRAYLEPRASAPRKRARGAA